MEDCALCGEYPALRKGRCGACNAVGRLCQQDTPLDSDRRGFMQRLPQTKGEWEGRPLTLMEWQLEPLRELFGRVDENGNRVYRRSFWFVPRKGGKSTVAAAVALYLLYADREPGAEIYGAAHDRDQASIVFNQAKAMMQKVPRLQASSKTYKREKRIEVPSKNRFYEAISAEASGSHGYNAHGVIFDEFHTQKDRELWDVLTTSVGSRSQPLIFAITTAGVNRESPCYREYDYACKVRDGVHEDDAYLPVIYEADEDDDWTDQETWEKANPGLGVTKKWWYIEGECARAQEEPEYENTFKRLDLNIWTSNEAKVLSSKDWEACEGDFTAEDLEGRPCYGGVDLASKEDIAACAWLFPYPDHVKLLTRMWVPQETAVKRSRKDGVPYDAWLRDGHLEGTPGNYIDQDYIEAQIEDDASTFDVKELAFDDWNCGNMPSRLGRKGLDVLTMRMGYKTLSEPTRLLLAMVRAGGSEDSESVELRHDGNPVMAWMADNLVTTESPMGDIKPAKNKSREKIDGIVAAIMSMDRYNRQESDTSEPSITVL